MRREQDSADTVQLLYPQKQAARQADAISTTGDTSDGDADWTMRYDNLGAAATGLSPLFICTSLSSAATQP